MCQRATIRRIAAERGDSLTSLSALIGRGPGYLQQYLRVGSPRALDEDDRRRLAIYWSIDERVLGARDPWSPPA